MYLQHWQQLSWPSVHNACLFLADNQLRTLYNYMIFAAHDLQAAPEGDLKQIAFTGSSKIGDALIQRWLSKRETKRYQLSQLRKLLENLCNKNEQTAMKLLTDYPDTNALMKAAAEQVTSASLDQLKV